MSAVLPPMPDVHFVEDQDRHRVGRRQHDLEGEHRPRELAAGGDPGERAGPPRRSWPRRGTRPGRRPSAASRHPSGPTARSPWARPRSRTRRTRKTAFSRSSAPSSASTRSRAGPRPAPAARRGPRRGSTSSVRSRSTRSASRPSLLAGVRELLQVVSSRAARRASTASTVSPYFRLRRPDLVQPALDRLEPRRVEDDAVAVAPEGRARPRRGGRERSPAPGASAPRPGRSARGPGAGRRAPGPLHGRGARVVVQLPVGRRSRPRPGARRS